MKNNPEDLADVNKADLVEIGKRLRRTRDFLDIKQKDFARPLNLTASFLSQIEHGRKKNPGVGIFLKISTIYHISLDYIFNGVGEMFLTTGKKSPGDKRVSVKEINNLDDLLWFFNRSSFFRNSLLGAAGKILLEYDKIIKKSLDIHRES